MAYSSMHNKISLLIVLVSIILAAIPMVSIVGKILLWGYVFNLFLFQLAYCKAKKWHYKKSNITIVLLLLGWMLIRAQNFWGFKNFMIFCLLMICYLTAFKFKQISSTLISIMFIMVVMFSFVYNNVGGEKYLNSNIAALVTVIVSFVLLVYFPDRKKILIPVAVISILYYDSRSIILSLFLSILIIFAVTKLKIRLGIVVSIVAICIIVGLVSMWELIMSNDFNIFIAEKTGKNFQSGRHLIWSAVFEKMQGINWLIGVGGGINHRDLMPQQYKNFSLHSAYIYMIFHYGVVGLMLLWTLFYKILKKLLNTGYIYSAILLLFFVLRDFFEITLINNQMAIAFLFWTWIANGWPDRIRKGPRPKTRWKITGRQPMTQYQTRIFKSKPLKKAKS